MNNLTPCMAKRLLGVLTLLTLVLILGACTASDDTQEDTSATSADSSEFDSGEGQYFIEEPDYLIEPDANSDDVAVLSEDGVQGMGYIPEGNTLAGKPFVDAHATSGWPADDRRYMCGNSTNVFVGEVIAAVSDTPQESDIDQYDSSAGAEIPRIQYSVALADMGSSSYDPEVKGTLDPSTSIGTSEGRDLYLVNQAGGQLSPADPVVLANGDPLLAPGDIALFYVNYESTPEWYTIVFQPQGDVRVPSTTKELDKLIRFTRYGCRYEKTPEETMSEIEAELQAGVDAEQEADESFPPPNEAEEE